MGGYNFHTHSVYSDGADTLEELVIRAIELGFDRLGFSEHSYTYFDESYCLSKEKTVQYQQEVRDLRGKYHEKIAIYLGIEQDLYSKESTSTYDYVIGSVHYVKKDGDFLAIDESAESLKIFSEKYYAGDIYSLIEDYFSAVGNLAQTECDIIGHFDLITKFNEKYPLFSEFHPRYQQAAQMALDKILQAGKIIEINTGAIARGWRTEPYPASNWLEYILKNNGRVLLASDCHDKAYLAHEFQKEKIKRYENYPDFRPKIKSVR